MNVTDFENHLTSAVRAAMQAVRIDPEKHTETASLFRDALRPLLNESLWLAEEDDTTAVCEPDEPSDPMDFVHGAIAVALKILKTIDDPRQHHIEVLLKSASGVASCNATEFGAMQERVESAVLARRRSASFTVDRTRPGAALTLLADVVDPALTETEGSLRACTDIRTGTMQDRVVVSQKPIEDSNPMAEVRTLVTLALELLKTTDDPQAFFVRPFLENIRHNLESGGRSGRPLGAGAD